MSNLDVLRAMMAAGPEATEQHDTKQLTAQTAASAGGEPIGWEDSVSIDGGSTSAASAAIIGRALRFPFISSHQKQARRMA